MLSPSAVPALRPREVLRYLEAPLRRPLLFLVPAILGTAVAVGAVRLVPPRYRSSTLILVEEDKVPEAFVGRTTTGRAERLATLRQEVLSRTRLQRVLDEVDPYPGERTPGNVGGLLARMRDATSIDVRGNDAFAISFVHRDPRVARDVANRLASLFIQESLLERERRAEEVGEFIESQLREARRRLEAHEEQLRRFRQQHMGMLPDQLPANLAALQRLQVERQGVSTDLQAALSRLAALESAAPPAPAPGVPAEIARLREQLAALRLRYTEEHPDVRALRARLERLETAQPKDALPARPALAAEIRQLQADVRTLRTRQSDLEARSGDLQARVDGTPRTEQQVTSLVRDHEKLKENYLGLLNKKLSATMATRMERQWKQQRFRVLDPANLPEVPVFPSRLRFLLLGLLGGLVAGLALCAAAETIDTSFASPEELSLAVAPPLLATIGHVRGSRRPAPRHAEVEPVTVPLPADVSPALRHEPAPAEAIPSSPLLPPTSVMITPVVGQTPPAVFVPPAAPSAPAVAPAPAETPHVAAVAARVAPPLPSRAPAGAAGPAESPAIEPWSVILGPKAAPAAKLDTILSETWEGSVAPRLVLMTGPAAEMFALDEDGELLLGSGPASRLRLGSPNVDPVHARIVFHAGRHHLLDERSSRGTYLNGARVTIAVPLRDGDQIFLGPPGSRDSARLEVRHQAPSADVRKSTPISVRANALPWPAPVAARPRRIALPYRRTAALAAAVLLVGMLVAGVHALGGAPELTSFEPGVVSPGQPLTLRGRGFAGNLHADVVLVGGERATLVAADRRELRANMPPLAGRRSGPVELVVESRGRRSRTMTLTLAVPPSVSSIDPEVAGPSAVVTASGRHLDGAHDVQVGGLPAEVLESAPERLRFRLPSQLVAAEGTEVPVVMHMAGGRVRTRLIFGHLPVLSEVTPRQGVAGERVVLRGYGFSPNADGNRVMFGERQALVLGASPRELTVAAPPPGTAAGQSGLEVTVHTADGASTTPLSFTCVRQPSGSFVPRFFAAPAVEHPGHDHAFVATELGPVLLLSGRGDAPSTAERAAHLSVLLNQLMESSAQPMALAVSRNPGPGVALAGGGTILVAATAADAAGYAEAWLLPPAPPRPRPETLAAYWTALLQDYLALFAHGMRPTRVAEMSERGQALLDLYAAGRRRALGVDGLPSDLLNPLSVGLATRLREMALLLPPDGQNSGMARVLGWWDGFMEETESGSRPLKLKLFRDGRRLRGLLRLGSGSLSLDTPLRYVAYTGGTLTFVAPLGPSGLRFRGAVGEDYVEGLIHQEVRGQAAGFFSLQYRE